MPQPTRVLREGSNLDLARIPLAELLRKRKSLRRRLTLVPDLLPIRVALLSGSTTQELAELLELQLLASGFFPTLYQSDYGRFETEALHDPEALLAFRPNVVYLHTSIHNLPSPSLCLSPDGFLQAIQEELVRMEAIWRSLNVRLDCTVVQNTFELPPLALCGSLELFHGQTRFVTELNRALVLAVARYPRVLLQDVHSISARIGLDHWFDPGRYFSYKIVTTPEGSQALALSLAAIIRGLYGKARKVLVLDLDNTLWGGVIGDDGLDHLQLGHETPVAEAYTAFQHHCLALRERGILLAVASKNDPLVARSGFSHPDSVLKLEHFASFQAGWNPKPESLQAIASELNLGLDSFVFVDDNPAERELVRAQLPQVAVPELPPDIADYPRTLAAERYFEQVALVPEDLARAGQYQQNAQRQSAQARFGNYGEYLASLQMTAEIAPFAAPYLDRIAQLTNKTNQFNLTTHRYTRAELESAATDPCTVTLYGRLSDRFGDNGLVSVILGRRRANVLQLDLWLMSCRVLKREMELAMLDAMVAQAQKLGVESLEGTYIPSRKNGLVEEHYPSLGFRLLSKTSEGAAYYILDLNDYSPRNRHIAVHCQDERPG